MARTAADRPFLPGFDAGLSDAARRGARLALRAAEDHRAALVAVALVWAAYAATWPLSGAVVPWDAKNHFYPMFRYLAAAFADGVVPYWNPFHYAGHPTVADPQSLLTTPSLALFAFLAPEASMQAFDLAVQAHLLLAGLCVVGLFARRGWAPAGALLAAVMVMLGGAATSRLQHVGMIVSYGFLPAAVLALEAALDRPSLARGALAGAAAALMALGRDQIAYFGLLLLLGVLAGRTFTARGVLAYLRARLPMFAAACLVGASLLAVPVLLTLQFLHGSNRPEIGYGLATMGSLPPASLATALFANAFGSINPDLSFWGPGPNTLPEGSWTDRSTTYLFAGTLPAFLVLGLGVARLRLLDREVRLFALALLGFALYALGRYTPLFAFAFDHLPGVSLYRRPADAIFPLGFAFAAVAGYLAHRYVEDGLAVRDGLRRSTAWIAAALALLAVAAACASSFEFAARAGRVLHAAREIAFALALAAAGAFALVLAASHGRRARVLAALALALATGAELTLRHGASSLSAEPVFVYSALGKLSPAEAEALAILRADVASRREQGQRPRVEVLGLGRGWQNAAMVHGLEDTLGYNALRLADYEEATGAGENAVDLGLRGFPGTFRGWRSRLAGLLGLEYLLLDRPIEALPARYPRPESATVLFSAPGVHLYRLPPAAPRTYVATRLRSIDAHEVIEAGELPEFERNGGALIDARSLPALKGDYGLFDGGTEPDAPEARARVVGGKRNRVTIEAETDRAGVLVLHDPWYPGWTVTVDGAPAPLLRMNLLFRGVEIPAGTHRVEFLFKPLDPANLLAAAREVLGTGEEAHP